MTFQGYTLSKRAEHLAPDWLFTTNNLSVKAMNEFQAHGGFTADGHYFWRRGQQIVVSDLDTWEIGSRPSASGGPS